MMAFDQLSRFELDEAAEFLAFKFPFINSVDLVIQLGSAQSTDQLLDEEWDHASLLDMPHLPLTESMAKHKMEIRWGIIGRIRTLVYSGRFHLYEGHGRVPCILPVWAAAAAGARNFLFTNAAAGIREGLDPGTLMLITDHINNLGVSPLTGHQHLLKRSPIDSSCVYSKALRESFRASIEGGDKTLHEGIYMAYPGPEYETPAEVKVARTYGADALGMSTVLEATTAHALGANVLGLSIIINRATGLENGRLSHEDAIASGHDTATDLVAMIRKWVHESAIDVL